MTLIKKLQKRIADNKDRYEGSGEGNTLDKIVIMEALQELLKDKRDSLLPSRKKVRKIIEATAPFHHAGGDAWAKAPTTEQIIDKVLKILAE